MNRRRRVNWWVHDGTLSWAVNACGQIVELRGDGGRWIVTVWTPLIPEVGEMVFNHSRASTAQASFDMIMDLPADELGVSVDEQIRRHWAMRMHPSWDHDGEERPW